MITFTLYKQSGLYLSTDADHATVGFMFADTTRTDATFTLSPATWADPAQQGYFAFFAPSVTRDWTTFPAAVRKAFQNVKGSQFGWFTEPGGVPTMASYWVVTFAAGPPALYQLQSSTALKFRNTAQLIITPSRFGLPTITFDDTANAFSMPTAPPRPGAPIAQLLLTAPNKQSSQLLATTPTLQLAMTAAQAGSLVCGFALGTTDLSRGEAGMMYFGPPPKTGQPLRALSYPAMRPAAAAKSINFLAALNVVQPLDGTRTYLQVADPRVGSYFASGGGHAFDLLTVASSSVADAGRFVFQSRPVNAVTDATNFYLAPAGRFGVALAAGGPAAPAKVAALLCGTTGTEFFGVPTAGNNDTLLNFKPGHAAYDTGAGTSNVAADYLDTSATTSWVQYETVTGSYVSQPEQSPLYDQSQAKTLSATSDSSGLTLFLLDFFPLPTWSPPSASLESEDDAQASATPSPAPAVPMVPYAGIPVNTQLDAYHAMERQAIYPQRRAEFSPAKLAKTNGTAALATTWPPPVPTRYAMTPQSLLAGVGGSPEVWSSLQIATSSSGVLQFTQLGVDVTATLQQNSIFAVITTTQPQASPPLFTFAGSDQEITIAGWPFQLSPDGPDQLGPDGNPPVVILKFVKGQTLANLAGTIGLWSDPDTYNDPNGYSATAAQTYIQAQIAAARADVKKNGKDSLYSNFIAVVDDPNFSGVLCLNATLDMQTLPGAIKGILGGMIDPDISAFRAHHVGVAINDTDPQNAKPTLGQSSLFGLIDYESTSDAPAQGDYGFQVMYLRALFMNSELRQFACKVNLIVNNLFKTTVNLGSSKAISANAGATSIPNTIAVMGSYQAHSTSGDDSSSGAGVYSFVAAGDFNFTFGSNPFLDSITLTKLQFAFEKEDVSGQTSTITSSFSIWGSMKFKPTPGLDVFSFDKLSFASLGIGVTFDLSGPPWKAQNLHLAFHPGNLRLDLANTGTNKSKDSMLDLLPFRLKSFLYSETGETLDSLNYFPVLSIPATGNGTQLADTVEYALIFDLDLGSVGKMVGSLAAFKFSCIIGWLSGPNGGLTFGIQLPQADGKLEIKIEGVMDLLIEQFTLQYVTPTDGKPRMLVVGLMQSSLTLFGQALPPGGKFDFLLFAPQGSKDKIGWLAAYEKDKQEDMLVAADDKAPPFDLIYLGGGQRVGPDPANPPTNFADFLTFMTDDLTKDLKAGNFSEIYHPDGDWLVVANATILGVVTFGFVFYDTTPFYSLTLDVKGVFSFEITYTKVTDTIGLFFASFTLPDSLRTFQVGAASVTLPSLDVSVYTNGNWKVDLGFPKGTDWSRCFQVQAMAGPVPVTGAGGFYLASLSSATSPKTFHGDYASILEFGFAARLGVGKDFSMGPFSAGVSLTFFGIIEGAAGYNNASSDEIFKTPDAIQLAGQFGIIGQLYGKVDFVIVSASVNVTLMASIGIVITYERASTAPNNGTILLYIDASVDVSVSVKIGYSIFSITISFSFSASFRVEWTLQMPGTQSQRELLHASFAELLSFAGPPVTVPLVTGPDGKAVPAALGLLFLPEITVLFADTTNPGTPWNVVSLGIPFTPASTTTTPPVAVTSFSQFTAFESVAAQLATWALNYVYPGIASSQTITLTQLDAVDYRPDASMPDPFAGLDYTSLLAQLGVFAGTTVSMPGASVSASVFPMPPFVHLETTGRQDADGNAAELDFTFGDQNVVAGYTDTVVAYFEQLFVNQAASSKDTLTLDGTPTPLVQTVFFEYFSGMIRAVVHQLVYTMQNLSGSPTSIALNQLILDTVQAGNIAQVAGQMASSFRGGVRLPTVPPYASQLTTPAGPPSQDTTALYALLWQEFPVGKATSYTIELSNADSTQTWFSTPDATDTLLSATVAQYTGIVSTSITVPSSVTPLPLTNSYAQSFSFQNLIPWTNASTSAALGSISTFPANLTALQGALKAPIAVDVQSRAAGAPYLAPGTSLPSTAFSWATQIQLNIRQVPSSTGSPPPPLADVYAISGASQQDQALLELVLKDALPAISSIDVLYQPAPGANGLVSQPITDPTQVFALRTNTTTVSVPPSTVGFMLEEDAVQPPDDVPVGGTIGNAKDFLRVVQQAAVTNAPGYYLQYLVANAGLPKEMFPKNGGPAPLTILIGFNGAPASAVQPYYNAIVLAAPSPELVYYAETTDAALNVQHPAVAPGAVGVALQSNNSSERLRVPAALRASNMLAADAGHSRETVVAALLEAGLADGEQLYEHLADANAGPAQLNALYALLSYRIAASASFIQSNMSAPIPPQTPAGGSATAQTYSVFAPLYNVAEANQPLSEHTPPNRYAEIGEPFEIDFFVNDAFGNTLPNTIAFNSTNLYTDPITPLDQWLGIITAYDFTDGGGAAKPNTFTVYLQPSASAFGDAVKKNPQGTVALYQTIQTQIEGDGVSFYVETNLCIDDTGAFVPIDLSAAQAAQVRALVDGIVASITSSAALPAGIALTFTAPASAPVPPVFELSVLFGIQRDPALISPLIKDGSVITYPAAQNVSTALAPTAGGTPAAPPYIIPAPTVPQFAADFIVAFSALSLAVGLNGAQQPQQQSTTGRMRSALADAGVANDGSGAGNPQSLWAVQYALIDITVDASGPFYASPMPLETTLNSQLVPLPVLDSTLPQLPASKLFTDVDLDALTQGAFAAIDGFLAPQSAAQAYSAASTQPAYTTVAYGRESIANEYSAYEIDWMFPDGSPFTPPHATPDLQLDAAKDAFGQQMRAGLLAAYSLDTIVQYGVTWNQTVPASIGDLVSLFGTVQTTQVPPPAGITLSTATVAVPPSGPGLLTFLFGTTDVQDIESVTLPLRYDVTHVEYFLAPKSTTPAGEARPSMWLQLVEPYARTKTKLPPVIGTGSTEIPVVFRQYPTTPTFVSQAALGDTSSKSKGSNPLTAAAAWHYTYTYQAQLTVHDQLLTQIQYNTDLSASGSSSQPVTPPPPPTPPYTLFVAIARFTAAYAVLGPILSSLPPKNLPVWQKAAEAFAALVDEIVQNSDWNPALTADVRSALRKVTDYYSLVDALAKDGKTRSITLTWLPPTPAPNQTSWPGATIAIAALDPATQLPYKNQSSKTTPANIVDTYTPVKPLVDNWALHRITVDPLSVLTAENALGGIQIERNAIQMGTSAIKSEFVYKTALVRPPQPATPFVDNPTKIDIATLKAGAIAAACPQSGPTTLCQRIFTMMNDLLRNPGQLAALVAANAQANVADPQRRVKVACGFAYPVLSVAGGTTPPANNPVYPIVPVQLARSFVVDVSLPDQLEDFSARYASAVIHWAQQNGVTFGKGSVPASGYFIFDVTLYAELAGTNTPVLRLSNLQLNLTDIDPSSTVATLVAPALT